MKIASVRAIVSEDAIVLGAIEARDIEAAAALLSAMGTVVSILLARKPSVMALPPEARSQRVTPTSESSNSIELPAEIVEKIFLAEETPDTTEDDIAAREAGIAFLEHKIAQAGTAEERLPIRRRVRALRAEIVELSGGADLKPGGLQPEQQQRERAGGRSSAIRGTLGSLFDPVWSLMYKLPPLGRRTRPWLAALVGFAFGGIGLSVYFRKLVDVLILLTLLSATVLIVAVVEPGLWWVGAAFASFYGFIRAESSNRRLAFQEVSAPKLASAGGSAQTAS